MDDCPACITEGLAERVHVGTTVESSSLTVTEYALYTCPQPSSSLIVKLYCSPTVFASLEIVPEITPPARLNPGGSAPEVTFQEYELFPPAPDKVAVYAVFSVPVGRFWVTIVKGLGLTGTAPE